MPDDKEIQGVKKPSVGILEIGAIVVLIVCCVLLV